MRGPQDGTVQIRDQDGSVSRLESVPSTPDLYSEYDGQIPKVPGPKPNGKRHGDEDKDSAIF